MTIYKEILKKLLTDCEKYQSHLIRIEELKNSIWHTSRVIGNVQERKLTDMLQQAEGQLDMIQFTCEDIFKESLKIVSGISEEIRATIKKTEALSVSDKDCIFVKLDNKEIQLWIEPEAGFFIKAVTEFGDSVRLSGDDARKLAEVLVTMADKADKVCKPVGIRA